MARKLTERQQKFIDALFAEANGSIKDAKIIAGYAPSTNNKVNERRDIRSHTNIYGK